MDKCQHTAHYGRVKGRKRLQIRVIEGALSFWCKFVFHLVGERTSLITPPSLETGCKGMKSLYTNACTHTHTHRSKHLEWAQRTSVSKFGHRAALMKLWLLQVHSDSWIVECVGVDEWFPLRSGDLNRQPWRYKHKCFCLMLLDKVFRCSYVG